MVRLESEKKRTLFSQELNADLVIAGGGLPGTCAAITAGREGLKVILVQDRPVLGGNASSEIRLWALGATSHMGNNNRWAREGGVIDELLTENLWRNPEGNPVIFDTILLDKVWNEPNITLLLDTAVNKIEKSGNKIRSIEAFNPSESISYSLRAPLFCDATGDGIVAYLAGASFRMGAEKSEEFNELLAPDAGYGELLGSTIYFYSKDTGKPVEFISPDFALKNISEIPRFERIQAEEQGCSFWWLEYGGRLDTIKDSAHIKRELLKVVYGVWDYIKNSGKFPEAENLTLEWVGSIPGKRESRRFEGDYMLTQSDIIEQHRHEDAVSYGGWAIDLHPADGVYSEKPPCNQYHSQGVYQIPYRSLYSRDVQNLFLAGRLISSSHIAFGSTRVMMTGAHNAQAIAVAASICRETEKNPADISKGYLLKTLQKRLLRTGQFIPFMDIPDAENLLENAEIQVSDTLKIETFPGTDNHHEISEPEGLLIPFPPGKIPKIKVMIRAESTLDAIFQLRRSGRYGNYSPDTVLEEITLNIRRGFSGGVSVDFQSILEKPEYLTVVILPAPGLSVFESHSSFPGILRLHHGANMQVATSAVQIPPPDSGIESFEFWIPDRRHAAFLWAASFTPALTPYHKRFLMNTYERPFIESNCWAVKPGHNQPAEILIKWKNIQKINRLIISMDSDFDHPMESVQLTHKDRVSPFLPRLLRVKDDMDSTVASVEKIHNSRVDIRFEHSLTTSSLTIQIPESWGEIISIFRISAY
jgi:hypothetical protein